MENKKVEFTKEQFGMVSNEPSSEDVGRMIYNEPSSEGVGSMVCRDFHQRFP